MTDVGTTPVPITEARAITVRRDVEDVGLKDTMSEMKNTLDGVNSK